MWRRILQVILAIGGFLLLLSAPLPLLYGQLLYEGAMTYTEQRAIRTTGMPTCPQILHWSEWHSGAGPTRRFELELDDPVHPQAEIIAYRTATDRALFAEYTFYQARYHNPDGTIDTKPAAGPKPLIAMRQGMIFGYLALAGTLAVLCFWMVARIGEKRTPGGDQSSGNRHAELNSAAHSTVSL